VTERARARRHIAGVALALSAVAWVLHLGHAAQALASPFCWSGAATGAWPSLAVLLQLHPPSALLGGWLLMLVAMMLPTLAAPLLHVHQRSFRQRRPRALTLFALGYFGVWLLAGGVPGRAAVLGPGTDRSPAGAGLAVLAHQAALSESQP
jgi:predicted metal-binding membrane protein